MRIFNLLFLMALILNGCSRTVSDPTEILRDDTILSDVRQYILKQNILIEEELQNICARSPDIVSIYSLSGSFCQCKWSWSVGARKSVTISYTGMIDEPINQEYMSYVVEDSQ